MRIVVRRPRGLHDEGSEETVAPAVERVHVIVEVGRAQLRVGIPAVAHELGAGVLALPVVPRQGVVDDELVAVDGDDARRFERSRFVEADADHGARLVPVGGRQTDGGGACGRIGSERVAHLRERSHGGLVVVAGDHAVASLHVELHEVHVQVDLAEVVVVDGVGELGHEQHVDAVLGCVGPDGERDPEVVVGLHGRLLLVEHEQLAVGVDQVGLLVQHDRDVHRSDGELLHGRPRGAQAVGPVATRGCGLRPRRLRLEVRRRPVVGRERGPLAQVRE